LVHFISGPIACRHAQLKLLLLLLMLPLPPQLPSLLLRALQS
jgi:hypothetical protein